MVCNCPGETRRLADLAEQPKGRRLTADEVRGRFLRAIWANVHEWAKSARCKNEQEKLEGLAFSILAILDGVVGFIPRFKVTPAPHSEDEPFLRAHGKDWYPADVDISGELHEAFYRYRPKGENDEKGR